MISSEVKKKQKIEVTRTYLIQVYLLSCTVVDEVLQVVHNVWPRILTYEDMSGIC